MSIQRIIESFDAIVGRLLHRIPFLAKRTGRVVSQGNDNSLEVLLDGAETPEGSETPPEVGAPIRTAIPGMVIRVPAGVRVQIGYEGGDASKPVAELFESGTPISITITTSDTCSVSAAGQAAIEHVTTIEAVASVLVAMIAAVPVWPPTPAQIASALAAAATAPLDPAARAAIEAWAEAAAPKTDATSPPGLGCKGFLSG